MVNVEGEGGREREVLEGREGGGGIGVGRDVTRRALQ